IVIDMYAPYVSLVKKLFPNAQLIIDRFHIVQHIGRTFLNHRVKETTARLKGTSHSQRGLGKKLKRYWKLLQKEEAKLNYEKRVWRASFKDYLTESEIVDRLLSACPNLYRPLNPFKQTLPKVLCFDEFKSVRHVTSAMSFIMMDGQSHALLDIVENRRLPYLERYFSRFSLATREAVQLIVIDMYAPYVSLVKKLFPNAQLIIDRFHIIQHIGRTFLNHRVKETPALLKGSSHSQRGLGKKLKRYWKLLQKEEAKLNYEKRIWRASFKDYLTESEIVDRLLAACPNLRQGYQLYQDVLYAVKKRDQSLFEDCLTRDISGLPETYTTTLRTFKKFLPQIQNALHYSYSNGPLECLNNHIKVLKRNAYGFRSFYNFKLRIMIRHGKTFLTK
ncbi:ISL3 family transposase, partial [Enterococcus durans]|uniref:ISL3 family transposase n=1 Tax=Enterococcus durans TaxID=53345 RepID=UPI001F0356BB